jgi:hypothetical protein
MKFNLPPSFLYLDTFIQMSIIKQRLLDTLKYILRICINQKTLYIQTLKLIKNGNLEVVIRPGIELSMSLIENRANIFKINRFPQLDPSPLTSLGSQKVPYSGKSIIR